MLTVVMQPTYLPWLGYFDLIDQSDTFVFYDTVQFEKQSWQQRNRIKTSQGELLLTVPVFHSFGQIIGDVRINNHTNWRHKHWQSIYVNYHKARFWNRYGPVLEEIYQQEWTSLMELNIHLTMLLSKTLGIGTRFVRASAFPLSGTKVEPLLTLCERTGAETYLSPNGARSYLTSEKPFSEKGIALRFQHYEHPVYPQMYGAFLPFLSVVDLLMNVGEESLDLIRSGRQASRFVE